jgi:hypothetical protein
MGMTPTGFTLQVSAPVGSTFVILASTDLRDWTPIHTNVTLNASVLITDATAMNFSQRFYRAVLPAENAVIINP